MEEHIARLCEYLHKNGVMGEAELESFLSFVVKYKEGANIQTTETQYQNLDFETKIIFSMADLFKSLTPDQCYDMAQRMYNRYIETNEDNYSKIISQMVRNIQNYRTQKLREIFLVWRLQSLADKEINQEREKLQAYINSLMQENEILDQERSYLEERSKTQEAEQSHGKLGISHSDLVTIEGPNMKERVNRIPVSLTKQTPKEERQQRREERENMVPPHSERDRKNYIQETPKNYIQETPTHYIQEGNEYSRSKITGSEFLESGNTIHSRLHDEASTKAELRLLNQELRKHKELEYCTFQPAISVVSEEMMTGKQGEVYHRLNKDNKVGKQEFYKAQKEAQEIEHCTFKPDLPKAQQRIENDVENIFNRLHGEAGQRDQWQRNKQYIKQQREIEGCTFQPSLKKSENYDPRLNQSMQVRSQSVSPRTQSVQSIGTQGMYSMRGPKENLTFDRLYLDHQKKRRKLMREEAKKEVSELNQCSFKPTINIRPRAKSVQPRTQTSRLARSRGSESSTKAGNRLFNLHAQKAKLIEQKKNELIEEERKMRKFTARPMKNPNLNNTSGYMTAPNPDNLQGAKNDPFERLYKMNEQITNKKKKMQKQLMKDSGISFTPRTNAYPNTMPREGFLDRNDRFMEEKYNKMKAQLPSEMKGCTFAPTLIGSGVKPPQTLTTENAEESGKRLFGFASEYERKRAVSKQKYERKFPFAPQITEKSSQIVKQRGACSAKKGTKHTKSIQENKSEAGERQEVAGRLNEYYDTERSTENVGGRSAGASRSKRTDVYFPASARNAENLNKDLSDLSETNLEEAQTFGGTAQYMGGTQVPEEYQEVLNAYGSEKSGLHIGTLEYVPQKKKATPNIPSYTSPRTAITQALNAHKMIS